MEQTGRIKFKKYRKVINLGVKLMKILPQFLQQFIWDLTSRYTQLPFIAIRYMILKARIKSCGENVRIGNNVTIIGWSGLIIGDNVSIHTNCYIDASGGITIRDHVSIAHNTSILSSNHQWENEALPIKYNPVTKTPVVIHEDVWIGCGVRILEGVQINSRAIVAAGAVVNKEVSSKTIVGGIPAKKIKSL